MCAGFIFPVLGDHGSGEGGVEIPAGRTGGERPALSGGSGSELLLITPSCPRWCPGMDDRWLECCGIPTAAWMD